MTRYINKSITLRSLAITAIIFMTKGFRYLEHMNYKLMLVSKSMFINPWQIETLKEKKCLNHLQFVFSKKSARNLNQRLLTTGIIVGFFLFILQYCILMYITWDQATIKPRFSSGTSHLSCSGENMLVTEINPCLSQRN